MCSLAPWSIEIETEKNQKALAVKIHTSSLIAVMAALSWPNTFEPYIIFNTTSMVTELNSETIFSSLLPPIIFYASWLLWNFPWRCQPILIFPPSLTPKHHSQYWTIKMLYRFLHFCVLLMLFVFKPTF